MPEQCFSRIMILGTIEFLEASGSVPGGYWVLLRINFIHSLVNRKFYYKDISVSPFPNSNFNL